jgi:hypothetical protein
MLAILLTIALQPPPEAAPVQTDADEYTRYELLDPASASFRILYEVTATTPGATFYFNPIRKGSTATSEAVFDRMSGQALRFEVVDGIAAKAGGVAGAASDTQFIRVHLPRPVPPEGEVRLLIDKTYRDPASYSVEGDRLVFSRALGITRNAVVLPPGYELVSCNVPAQVLSEPDGRIKVSFVHTSAQPLPVLVKARRLP